MFSLDGEDVDQNRQLSVTDIVDSSSLKTEVAVERQQSARERAESVGDGRRLLMKEAEATDSTKPLASKQVEASREDEKTADRQQSVRELSETLYTLIVDKAIDNETVVDWIKTNIPEPRDDAKLIFEVTSLVCKVAITGETSE